LQAAVPPFYPFFTITAFKFHQALQSQPAHFTIPCNLLYQYFTTSLPSQHLHFTRHYNYNQHISPFFATCGYDPLIAHLQNRQISACRHGSFETLPFVGPTKPTTPATPTTTRKAKPQPQPKSAPDGLGERETRVLDHFRKPSATRPRTQDTLVRFLVGYFGRKITEADALSLVETLGQAGHLVIGDKGKVTYHLETK